VAKQGKRRGKHVPQRTCVGCRTVEAKRILIRIVRTPEGLKVDPKGKMPGRGAYLHDRRSCWQAGLNGRLARALKTTMSEGDLANLTAFMETLPEEENDG
jgi:predicted RNA-binding protein YlxR (DUF448 family)